MDKGKKNKDILADLLSSTDEDADVVEARELDQIIHRSFKGTKKATGPSLNELNEMAHRSFRLSDLSKKKTTIYLSSGLHKELLQAKKRLRSLVPEDNVSQVSMSGIVDNALKIMLKELELKGGDSILVKQLSKKSSNKA